MSLIDPMLLEILRCPVCLEPVSEDEPGSALVCSKDPDHRYPVEDGIPNMLPPGD